MFKGCTRANLNLSFQAIALPLSGLASACPLYTWRGCIHNDLWWAPAPRQGAPCTWRPIECAWSWLQVSPQAVTTHQIR